jgi:pilus assembly protein CpaE
LTIFNDHLGITTDRVLIVLNRYSKKAEVRLEDFTNAFPGVAIETIPSDYALVSESINLGTPVVDGSKRTSLAKSITGLSKRILPPKKEEDKQVAGLLGLLGLAGKQ